jgi:hypothetical protein
MTPELINARKEQQSTFGEKNIKEWLAALTPHDTMDFEAFKARCTRYVDAVIVLGGNNCEFIENDDNIEAKFTNGAEAMWSKAGHLAYRNDMRF